MRQQHERRAVRAAGFCGDRDVADTAANGLNAGDSTSCDPARARRTSDLMCRQSILNRSVLYDDGGISEDAEILNYVVLY
jgi:hypothetical protein